jgi:hypothetical protein
LRGQPREPRDLALVDGAAGSRLLIHVRNQCVSRLALL